jgi:hypothetical protein
MKKFLSDVKELRRRARQHLEQGPVTDGYKADPKKVIAVLNEALATELVCVLRYTGSPSASRNFRASRISIRRVSAPAAIRNTSRAVRSSR